MQILIVDDDPTMLALLENAITGLGHRVTAARDGYEALELLRTGEFRLVISDWEMPRMDGIELCRHIRQRYFGSYVYIILLTVRTGTENIIDGLSAGADEFVSKPLNLDELAVRIRAGERILSIESRDVTIFALARLAESRDQETGAHVDRLREYSRIIAEHLASQPKFHEQVHGDFIQLIYATSPLHDVGKVGIPDKILLKAGPLTEDEFEIMKQHTVAGAMTLESAIYAHPEAKYLCMARDIARSHHEWFDGSGYPDGLVGDAIPLSGRIVGLVDVYDALTTKRVYKPAFSHEVARQIIIEGSGTQFDPDIVRAFLANEDRFIKIFERFAAREEKEVRVLSRLENELSLSC
jgi:putative two-component system response regulator